MVLRSLLGHLAESRAMTTPSAWRGSSVRGAGKPSSAPPLALRVLGAASFAFAFVWLLSIWK